MLGFAYSITADAVSTSAADDLLRITAPSDASIIIERVVVTQETQTSSEALAVQLMRASTAGGGTAVTAKALVIGAPAAGTTGIGTITTDTTPGDILVREGWNVLAPFDWHPVPENRIVVKASGIFAVRLDVAPASAMTITSTIYFREIGT